MSSATAMAPIAWAYLVRGLWLWIGARLLAALVFVFARIGAVPTDTVTGVYMVALAMALGVVDVRRRRERALLGDLGVPIAVLLSWFAVPAICGELLLRLLSGSL